MRSKVSFSSTDCARARESVSVQLDGELLELELDRLETHLRVCPDCSAWAEEVRDVTLCLREATLEVPVAGVLLTRRRRTRATAPIALVAAAAASLVVVLGSVQSHTAGSGRSARFSHLSQLSAPALTGLENARLGLENLPPRSSTVPQVRFRAV
jgi:predicted anti-sigma-YlaC factor YlaD